MTSVAFADPTCSTTKWKMFDEHIPFGTATKDAVKILKKVYANTANVTIEDGNVVVTFKQQNRATFDLIIYLAQDGIIFKVSYSYSNRFQESMGGLAKAFTALSKKIIARVGEKADNAEKVGDDAFLASWNTNGGARQEVFAKDPNLLTVRFICDELEQSLAQKRVDNANFGF